MNANNQGARQMDTFDYLKVWWNQCPQFTSSMVYICTISWILELFIPIIPYLFPNVPLLTIGGLGLQRLLLSPFFCQGLLGLIFGFLVFLPMSAKKEKEWGTVKTIVDFFYKNFLINLTFCAFCYAMSLVSESFLKSPCFGLWPIYFYYLVERCLLDPNGVSQVFCFPVHVRNTLYPIILLLLFSLFSQMILYDLAIAILIGFVHFKYLNNSYHSYLNEGRCSRWESSLLFNWLRSLPNYVSPSGNMFANRGAQQQQQQANTGANLGGYNNAPPVAQPQAFSAFKGKGVTLGGSDEPPQASSPPIPKASNGQYAELNDDSADLEQGK